MSKSLVHFVGFRDDRYNNAIKIWGKPDFIHMHWDRRSRREVSKDDIIIFATGSHDQIYHLYNSSDIIEEKINE